MITANANDEVRIEHACGAITMRGWMWLEQRSEIERLERLRKDDARLYVKAIASLVDTQERLAAAEAERDRMKVVGDMIMGAICGSTGPLAYAAVNEAFDELEQRRMGHSKAYEPSPTEIRQACEQIRRGWPRHKLASQEGHGEELEITEVPSPNMALIERRRNLG